jgi:D-3-phosphoglycerate dehydrogenase
MSPVPKPQAIRILVSDGIAAEGVELLRATPGFDVTVDTALSPEQLAETIGGYDGLIVRSATKVTADVLDHAGRLKVIGRAGTGVDNIDLEAATRAGTVVMNTPGGNSVAAAELTLSHLMALARNLPQANADLRAGRWERKRYTGIEIAGKTIGIVGLGRIGREVARRAKGLRMEILGFDPFVSRDAAAGMGIEYVALDDLLSRSDFVTLHLPLTDETRHLIDARALGRMKDGARLINCARGGLVDERALYEALDSGHLAGAGLDVFETEPPSESRLIEHPNVISTPHLGASTIEAQQRVGVEIAEKVRDFFVGGVILDAVNFPSINREEHAALGPLMDLTERLGRFLAQVVEGGFRKLELQCYGEFVDRPLRPLVMAATKGLLTAGREGAVSFVNALSLAGERGITVSEGRSNEATPYAGLVRLILTTDREIATVAGTLYGPENPKLVQVDGVPIECRPEGHLLFLRNQDVPGVVGRIGTLLGEAGVNIAGIHLGRSRPGENAVSIVSVDSAVPPPVLAGIRAVPQIVVVRALTV